MARLRRCVKIWPIVVFILMFLFSFSNVAFYGDNKRKMHQSFRPSPTDPLTPLFIYRFSSDGTTSSFSTPLSKPTTTTTRRTLVRYIPYYEAYRPLSPGEYERVIREPADHEQLGQVYTDTDFMDGNDDYRDKYYAFDDDYVRNPKCQRTAWHRLYRPMCLLFHEMDLRENDDDDSNSFSYVAHGHYRDVWGVADDDDGDLSVVLKTMRYKHSHKYDQYEYTRMDALVMERLTASPRIVDIYGHCALSVVTEAVRDEIETVVVPGTGYVNQDNRLNDRTDVDVRNHFTPTEKLTMALEMAEAIADLHGFADGVIVHDDIQLRQFLRAKDGTLKLNDFNRAEIMLYDQDSMSYCKYKNGGAWGNYRAPEEYRNDPLNEKIDVWSFGNNCYALLTGVWNFYDYTDDSVVQEKVKGAQTAYIDDRYRTRSYAEGQLVKIMEKCWTYKPDERISIFEVVKFLQLSIKENERLKTVAAV